MKLLPLHLGKPSLQAWPSLDFFTEEGFIPWGMLSYQTGNNTEFQHHPKNLTGNLIRAGG
jgi:hypothetical protein